MIRLGPLNTEKVD